MVLRFRIHLTTLVIVDSRAAGAQSSCASSALGASGSPADGELSGVLARRVSLHGRDVSLREALDRLAATAHIRLLYTAELLPLTRAVCLAYESASVGAVLMDLLDGTSLRPIAAGNDQVVLAPTPEKTPPMTPQAAAFQNTSHPLYEFLGAQLRTYWRKYDGVTRMSANFGYNIGRGLSFTVRGENLLDKQEGEPDNVTVLPGRTVTGGLRVSF